MHHVITLAFLTLAFGCPVNYYGTGGGCMPCPPSFVNTNNATNCTLRTTQCSARRLATPLPCTQCTASQFYAANCTPQSDAVCQSCTLCSMSQYQVADCTLYADRICKDCGAMAPLNAVSTGNCSWECKSGYWLLNNTCTMCPANSYCNNNTQYPCPPNTISIPGSGSFANCTCPLGTYGLVFENFSSWCVTCPPNYFCRASLC